MDWEHNRLTVRSPKTEHHEGHAERIVPLFPEVREHLLAVFEQAEPGAVDVIGRYRQGSNLNPQLRRIVKRAGLTPWDRTWHNLRASRQTELAASFPLHTVCAWIGNSKPIAAGHDLQVTDADWSRAVGAGAEVAQKAAQQSHADTRTVSPMEDWETKNPATCGAFRGVVSECEDPDKTQVGRGGLEPPTPAFSVPCSTN